MEKLHAVVSRLHQSIGLLILILVIAAVGIITFLAVFSARHRWDMQEQRYRELIDQASKTNKTT